MSTAASRKVRAERIAIVTAAGLAVGKFGVGLATNSIGLLSAAADSLFDVAMSSFNLWSIRLADSPADEGHPFGHGKARFFWGLVVAIMLFSVGGGFSVWHGIQGLIHGHELPDPLVALIVIALAICFEGYAWRTAYQQLQAERRGRSIAGALRNSKDPEVLTVLAEDTAAISGLVVAALGIGLASLTGVAAFDAAASVIIGLILLVVAFLLGRENAMLLIGEGIDPQIREAIEEAIREVDGVEGLLELLTMHLGPDEVLVTADVRFSDDLSTEEIAHTIDRVEAAIREVAPEAKRIYVEPEIRWREEANQ
jgi:cation diffusion facilitator family transporter